ARLFLAQTDLHAAIEDVVKRNQSAVHLHARPAIPRRNLGTHAPRLSEIGFVEDAAGKTHRAQQFRKGIHSAKGCSGVSAMTSGVPAIPRWSCHAQSIARAG